MVNQYSEGTLTLNNLDSNIRRLMHKQAYPEVINLLKKNTGEKQLIQPEGVALDNWNDPGFHFLKYEMYEQAETLYKALYEVQISEQDVHNKRYCKGMALHNWGMAVLRQGRRPEAEKLITLAYIEDCITGGKLATEKLAYKVLTNEFRIEQGTLEGIYACAISRKDVSKRPPKRPEMVLETFGANQQKWERLALNSHLVTIDLEFFKTLLEDVKTAKTNDEKKKTLELLAERLFSSIKDFTVLPSQRTATSEIDRIIRNYSQHPLLRSLSIHILIECKNWSEPANAKLIREFLTKIEDHRCTCGILLSKKGITGKEAKDAMGVIRDAYRTKGIAVLLISEKDLDEIADGENPINILEGKFEKVRFM